MQRTFLSSRRPLMVRIGVLAWVVAMVQSPATQGQTSFPVPPTEATATGEPEGSSGEIWDVDSFVEPEEDRESPLIPALSAATRPPSFLNVAWESLFGDAYSEARRAQWRDLTLRTFFTEGWRESYIDAPAGSGGAPRHGWVNFFEGTFYRAWFLAFAYAGDVNHNGNQYLGDYTIWAPLNRRFEIRLDVPFVSNRGGVANHYHDRFGDLVISPRVLLSSTADFSQIFALSIRTPTGSRANGNALDSLTPLYQFWWNPYGNWAVRGGLGIDVPTSSKSGSTFGLVNFGVGRYWKGEEGDLLRHQWLSLVANLSTPLSGSAPGPTYLSLTPGYRVQIHGTWFFLAGLEVPVTAHAPFAAEPIFFILKDY